MWWCHHLSLLWFLAYLSGYKQVIPCDGAIIYLCFDSLLTLVVTKKSSHVMVPSSIFALTCLPWWLQTSHPMWWCHHLSLLWLAYLGGYKQVIPCDGAIIYLCFDSLLTLVVTNKSSRVMVPSSIFALIPCSPWWLQTSHPVWWCYHLSLLWFLAYLGGYKQVIPCDGAIIYLCFDSLPNLCFILIAAGTVYVSVANTNGVFYCSSNFTRLRLCSQKQSNLITNFGIILEKTSLTTSLMLVSD